MPIRTFSVPPEAENMRVSDYLRSLLPDLPESVLRKIFAARDVRLDDRRVSRDEKLRSGQVLKVFLPASAGSSPAPSPLDVVYEDDHVLLVCKRAGISVEADARGGPTLTDLCTSHVRQQRPEALPPAACHRLDNRTCGLCLFAKDPRTLEILRDVFRTRKLEKYYECLVRGIIKPPRAVCHAWLVKDSLHSRVRILDHPDDGAKPIVTGYETLEAGPVSRLRVHLITGRTHQIRAHLASLGHPILGDDVYGDRDFNRREKARSLKLCAVSLTIDTEGRLPALDGRTFTVPAPF